MAGSWDHMTNDDGTPFSEDMTALMDTTGDLAEALWECYGMIWWLAAYRARLRYVTADPTREQIMDVIKSARENHEDGVRMGRGATG